MANIKISELTALTPPDAADLVPVTDASASQTKRTTVGEIVGIINGDVDVADDGTATISELPVSKLQDGTARQLLQTDAAGTGVEWTSDVDVPGTLDVTGAATLDSTLGVDGQSTLASAAVSDLTSGRVVLAGTSGELEDSAGLTFNGTQLDVDGNVVITGDLTVEGASTILETQTVTVEDKNIELGVVASPTDVTADGGGITLKGTTDKTINWVDATDSWTSSENIDLASGKSYRINNTEVLNATTLGSGVTSSSLTSVGTITAGTWQGTAIDATYLDSTVVTTGDTGTVTSTMIADGTIVNADVSGTAAIAGSKINPNFGSQTIETTGDLAINTDTLFVDASADKVGIGSSLPGAKLAVQDGSNAAGAILVGADYDGTVLTNNSTKLAPIHMPHYTNAEEKIRLIAGYSDASQSIVSIGGGTGSANAATKVQIYTAANTTTTSGTAAITVDSSQRVGVGTSPSYQLQLSTDSAGKPSTNTWTIVSDERIKEEIEFADLDLCYEAVKNIPLKRFKWKDEIYTEEQVYDRRKLGWIAQDVEAVFPKAVRHHEFKYNQVFEEILVPAVPEELDDDGNVVTEAQPERIEKGELISEEVIEDCRDLNSDQLYAAMYGAIQKLISKVETLEAEVAALKA